MRLDEWQKWLDQQWLDGDDDGQPATPQAPAEVPGTQPAAPAAGPAPVEAPTDQVQPSVPETVTPPQSAAPSLQPASGPQTVAGQRPVFPPVVRPAVQARVASPAPEEDEGTLPSIGSFLPSRRRAPEPQQTPAPAPVPSAAPTTASQPPPQVAPPIQSRPPAFPPIAPRVTPAPVPASPPPTSAIEETAEPGVAPTAVDAIDAEPQVGAAEDTTVGAVDATDAEVAPPTKAAPPLPVTPQPLQSAPVATPETGVFQRPRRTRKTSAAPAASLDAAELWALVPRHIRTLVAMDGEETAQRSYKRQFRESRLELVQRLLDPTLSLEDTARLLNVCPTTVRRYTNKGLLTHQRTAGDQRRFRLSDVLAFLEAHGDATDRQGEP